MSFITAALILVGLLGVINLALIFGVIRRQREHTELLSRNLAGEPATRGVLPPGKRPSTFSATTVDGEPVAAQGLALVGFLAQGCRQCRAQLPLFVRAAQATPGGRSKVLAVVVGGPEVARPDDSAVSHLAQLREIAQVVVEQRDGPIATAFQVEGFPAFCRLDADGTVIANDDEALTPGLLIR